MVEAKKIAEIEPNAVIADTSGSTSKAVVAPPPPPPHRRPRVREVSSRFMSPVASSSSSSCSDIHLLTAKLPHHKQQQQQQKHRRDQDKKDPESVSSAEVNRPIETARSLESPFHFLASKESLQRRQQQPRSVMKLFSENNPSRLIGRYGNSSRSDTPIVANSSSSRPRTLHRSTGNTASAATKLLQSISNQDDTSSLIDDSDNDSRSCTSDTDILPTVSVRMLSERNINRVNASATPCLRSLNLQLSTSQNGLFSSIKGAENQTPALSRSFTNSAKIGVLTLPPVPPPQAKLGTDARKGRKVSGHQEDVHSLKLLQNHYLQWRFANAKAEASSQAQRRETEKSLYSLGVKISELHDLVKGKRIELEILKRRRTLSTILGAQMPYLEEWSALEEDYSSSSSEAIQALLNASIQLPIGGHVRGDFREVGEALNCAAKLMEMILVHLQSFMPKAEEVEILISKLSKVTGGDRALVEECGCLLSKTHTFQVEECSLRGQLMQLHDQRLAVADQFQQEINNSSLNAVHMR